MRKIPRSRWGAGVAALIGASALATPPVDHDERPTQVPGIPATARGPAVRLPAVGTPFAPVQVNVDRLGLNTLGDAANEPSIAVDPTAPNRLVIGWRQFDTVTSSFRQAGAAVSWDGGRTWRGVGPLDAGVFRSDPVLAADTHGAFYYYSLTDGLLCDLFLSDDGGLTWSGPIPAFGGDKQWFVVDTCADRVVTNVYAAWRVYAGCCAGATFTRSLDGGTTFSPPVEIAGMPNFGTLAIGPDRELYVCGVGFFDYSDFMVARTDRAFDPAVAPEFVQRSSADLGGSLVVGAAVNPAGLLGQLWIGVDTSSGPHRGNLYLLASTHDVASPDPMDVHLARSRDGGLTWQPPVRVNDDPVAAHAWQWFGTMSVAPTGRIDVIWNDTRDDPTATHSTIYFTSSTDGGRTFAPSRPITVPFNHFLGYPQQSKLGDYYHMVSDRVGAHLAFAATFNGEQDVYYLRIGEYDCNDSGVGDASEIRAGDVADCNGNGIPDACEIAAGSHADANGNGVLDSCELPADLDGSGEVDWFDLLLLLSHWGPCPPPPATCFGDVDGDGAVGFLDLLALLDSWS